MRRSAILLGTAGALVVAVVLVRWWWTSPPLEDTGRLTAAAAITPAGADGVVVFARPARTARWLTSHPQALALLRLAAPTATETLPRIRRFLVALASEAGGPLSVWWRGPGLAVGADVGPGAARVLQRLAALEGLAFRARPAAGGSAAVAASSDSTLLEEGAGTTPPGPGPGRLTALAHCGGRWWRARAGRSTLELVSGEPVELRAPTDANLVATSDIAALAGAAIPLEWVPSASARILFNDAGWGVSLPGTPISPEVRRLLSLAGDTAWSSPPGARRWRGPLGELWVLPGPGLAIASGPDLLGQLPSEEPAGEVGVVRGADLARLLRRAAEAANGLPGSARYVEAMRRAGPLFESLRLVRWRLLPAGGRILFEW